MATKLSPLSRRTVLLCLLTLILFSIALRYPTSPHQLGADGYFNNAMARFIIDDGYAKWILSPFSYMGLGPFSYPAASHFMMASVSQIAHIPIEETVLYMSMLLGICGVLFSFIVGKELFKSNEIALLTAFVFSTSPEFIRLTRWNGSSRAMVMVFFLILMFTMIKSQYAKRSESHSTYYEAIFSIMTVMLLEVITTIHRMWIFAAFIVIAYIMARPFYGVKRMIKIRMGVWKPRRHLIVSMMIFVGWGSLMVFFLLAQLNNLWVYNEMNLWYKYQGGFLFSGSSPGMIFLNMLIDYGSGYGILSIFFALGAIIMFKRRNKTYTSIFLLSAILFTVPIATLGIYSKLILILFIAPVIGFGTYWILNVKNFRRVAFPMLIAILVISSGFSIFMINHWQESSGGDYMTYAENDVGLFVRYNVEVDETYISNNQVFGNKVLAMADCQYLTDTFPYPAIFGWKTKNDVDNFLDWEMMIEEMSIEINYPEELEVTLDHREIRLYALGQSHFLRDMYNIRYSVEHSETTYTYTIGTSIHETRYLIFDNSEGVVWYLG